MKGKGQRMKETEGYRDRHRQIKRQSDRIDKKQGDSKIDSQINATKEEKGVSV